MGSTKRTRFKVNRRVGRFHSDCTRVITRLFAPGSPDRLAHICRRILDLSEADAQDALLRVLTDFKDRHKDIKSIFLRHYEELRECLPEGDILKTDTNVLSEDRKLLMGAYFTNEYSVEAAAFFNPSIILHPDQEGLPEGSIRFIMSFRATGEGHVSSIVFRAGTIDEAHRITFDPVSPYVQTSEMVKNRTYDKRTFSMKIKELGFENLASEKILGSLDDAFMYKQLENAVWRFSEKYRGVTEDETVDIIKWLARSNYDLRFQRNGDISERVIFPVSENESKGLEDARFVRFVEEDGSAIYYATYTAYNGFTILPQLLTTRDFLSFRVATLNGAAVQNKGMALFPRKVDGKYAMISRQDGENLFIMFSSNLHFWHEAQLLQCPEFPWDLVQIGNCGSPIETEEGWLLLIHGVGPMRTYVIGAMLLDRADPTRVLAYLREPILIPNEEEREGYVPNVVYSCGAIVHSGELILPYAMSDSASGIATVSMAELMSQFGGTG